MWNQTVPDEMQVDTGRTTVLTGWAATRAVAWRADGQYGSPLRSATPAGFAAARVLPSSWRRPFRPCGAGDLRTDANASRQQRLVSEQRRREAGMPRPCTHMSL